MATITYTKKDLAPSYKQREKYMQIYANLPEDVVVIVKTVNADKYDVYSNHFNPAFLTYLLEGFLLINRKQCAFHVL
ncbi:hypothetical protein [Vibrio fluvialis]|uniref:hypothetical protein n=1 Tax=Vibrio fluvialis TaxID=676 RepID=UPI001559440F|nr:hypothetical protein [Vibrio fluvialis]